MDNGEYAIRPELVTELKYGTVSVGHLSLEVDVNQLASSHFISDVKESCK